MERRYVIFSIQGKYDASEARFARGSGAKRLSGRAANRTSVWQRPTDGHRKLRTLDCRLMLDDESAMC
jgi:hypothetical protein